MAAYETVRDEFLISTDKAKLDLERIVSFLGASYWAAERTRETIERSIANSLVFGVYDDGVQIGFARAVTDTATFAWICDVFVDEEYRGRGLGTWMMQHVMAHPEIAELRLVMLATRDAHELYRPFGFVELPQPNRWMERRPAGWESPLP
jgi:GNAT superfamily N-acetyltransferase